MEARIILVFCVSQAGDVLRVAHDMEMDREPYVWLGSDSSFRESGRCSYCHVIGLTDVDLQLCFRSRWAVSEQQSGLTNRESF